ncbi:MAG TPA: aromatic ring-hydroxylating dioxygenase subunit alpha [Dehalococcoidia bacterium]|nr:aromatic ring-hydroxylating dioxygenase subunit alpha [Dehalococcoidia bacterium]
MASGTEVQSQINPLHTVHNSVYTRAAYELELERIFRRSWIFVCHESEVPEPGSFVTKQVAGDPILIVRDGAGQVQAFNNVCRHRGSLVAPDAAGSCENFTCPYHHWTYSLEGDLIGVPGEEAYSGSGFSKEQLGLVPVRCETVYNLTFVCLSDSAPPLRDFLGEELLSEMERPLGRAEYEQFHYESWTLKANWKVFGENQRDGYHVPFVHQSFLAKGSPAQPYRLFPEGHAIQRLRQAQEAVDEKTWAETNRDLLPGMEPGEGWVVNIFPDFLIMVRNNVSEILSQVNISHDEVLYEVRLLGLKGDSEEQRANRRRSYEVWLQSQQPEDKAIMEIQQRGLQSRGLRTSLIARGAEATEGVRGDDNRLRQFWQAWRGMMDLPANSLGS